MEYISEGDISEQIILLEIPKLFSEIISNGKNVIKNLE